MTITHTTTIADDLDAWLPEAIASVAEQLDGIKALPEFIAWAEREAHDEIQTENGWIPRITTEDLAIVWFNRNHSDHFTPAPPMPRWANRAEVHIAGRGELGVWFHGASFTTDDVSAGVEQYALLSTLEDRPASEAIGQPTVAIQGISDEATDTDVLERAARVLQAAAQSLRVVLGPTA